MPASEAAAVNARLIALDAAWPDRAASRTALGAARFHVSPVPSCGSASWMLPGIRYEIETDAPAEVPAWAARYLAAVERLAMDRAREGLGR